jgi:uncharacterized iron-regulated protein
MFTPTTKSQHDNQLFQMTFMKKTHLLSSLLLFSTIVWLTGCGTIPQATINEAPAPVADPIPDGPQWKIFDASSGSPLDWNTAMNQLFEVDVIVVGEQHDNLTGHHVEAELTEEFLGKSPSSCIAMEMFERNEQAFVDLYLGGGMKGSTLVKITNSSNWGGGTNTWNDFYQPIVDTVKKHRASGAGLKAANCPRSYVQLARLEGFDSLESIRDETALLFEIPDLTVDDAPYKARFVGLMSPVPAHTPPEKGKTEPEAPKMGMHSIDPEAFFWSQQVWDASMADSVVDAKNQHPKVMLFVGEFHMAYEGGLVRRIRAKNPGLKLATVSILRSEDINVFNPEDVERADLLIYTR